MERGRGSCAGPQIEPEDRASVLRVARYGARAPVAESRLRYDAERAEVELVSDASEGPYAGVHRFAALEFLARRVDYIPAKGEVRVRYYGAYASRRWGWWRRRGLVLAGARPEDAHDTQHEAEPWPALQARRRHWAELLRMVFAVGVEVCPRCGGEMRNLAFVTEPAVVRRILAHLERGGIDGRAGSWAGAAACLGRRPAVGVPGVSRSEVPRLLLLRDPREPSPPTHAQQNRGRAPPQGPGCSGQAHEGRGAP